MDKLCLQKLTELRTKLEIKKSDLESSNPPQLEFSSEEELAEGITNRCQEQNLLDIRQSIENLNPDDLKLSESLRDIIEGINNIIN